MMQISYDVIVVGGGHAGCEAALASARMGMQTALLTMNLDTIAQMSCNPAIGGLAKGQLVREVDALGGKMGKVIDATGIQFKLLNASKGHAVRSPRAQADKKLYQFTMKGRLERQANLSLRQDSIEDIAVHDKGILALAGKSGTNYRAKAVIITTGTFLNGLIHIGNSQLKGGRSSEPSADKLSNSLRNLGFELDRLKTGTPPRLNGNSINYGVLQEQVGDEQPTAFSYSTEKIHRPQIKCYITYTNSLTHEIIRSNLDRSPNFTGQIKAVGPRYCPSIEDKITRFPDKDHHQIFLEPEGLDTTEVYCNGISTCTPFDVQEAMVHSIKGLENADITRYGYAIEYDFFFPSQLKTSLESKNISYESFDETELLQKTAQLIADGNIIGWYQGKMEWGPRALGNRSILADPRREDMKDILNAKIKHRESFRPFAPSILEEYASDYFDIDVPSPYMLMVSPVRKPKEIPAVTHVDGTGRLQTVSKTSNRLYYDLINEFYKITNVPVIINTSMNVRGEPIVNTPEQAYNMLTKTDMDYLFMKNFMVKR